MSTYSHMKIYEGMLKRSVPLYACSNEVVASKAKRHNLTVDSLPPAACYSLRSG